MERQLTFIIIINNVQTNSNQISRILGDKFVKKSVNWAVMFFGPLSGEVKFGGRVEGEQQRANGDLCVADGEYGGQADAEVGNEACAVQ